MEKLLLVVEDAFAISGVGVGIMPLPGVETLGGRKSGHKERVRLHRLDGSKREAQLKLSYSHFNMLNSPNFWAFEIILLEISKADVPPGTEIWLLDAP